MRAALALAALHALAGPAAGAESAASGEREDIWARGRLDLRYVFRSTGEGDRDERDRDQDLVEDLRLEAGRGDRLRFEASGRVREDVDGRPDVSRFRDIYDTYGEPVTGFLYTAYGEALDRGPLARIRLGRQFYAEGLDVRFDGALVETEPLGGAVALTAYGGVPAHLFESSARGDGIAGAALELVSIPRTTVRLDYAHVTDRRRDLERAERRDGVPRDALRDDDLWKLAVVHRLTQVVRLRAEASTFEGRSSRLSADALLLDPDLDLSARLRYVVQVGAYRDLSVQFTPLDEVLGRYEPYHEVLADVRKGVGEHLSLGAGAAVRELADEDDEGPFNHEFRRYFGSIDATDWPWKGLTASLLGEWYRSDAADRSFQGSADLAQEIGPVTVGAGTSYALYRFDDVFLEEREDVRAWFGTLEWRVADPVRLRLGYTFEQDDEDRYHVARCDLRLTF